MKQLLEYGSLSVEHRVNPRMKHCYIVIENDAKVVLKSPRISRDEALKIVAKKSAWIRRKLKQQEGRPVLSFRLGEEVGYLGETHALKGNEAFDDLSAAIGRLRSLSETSLQRCYDEFFKRRAADYLPERTAHFEALSGLEAKAFRFRKMRSRWGSCSRRGVITFNTQIMRLPERLIDYVVMHELAHLRHMNHSAAFYRELEKTLPDHRVLQKELRAIRII